MNGPPTEKPAEADGSSACVGHQGWLLDDGDPDWGDEDLAYLAPRNAATATPASPRSPESH